MVVLKKVTNFSSANLYELNDSNRKLLLSLPEIIITYRLNILSKKKGENIYPNPQDLKENEQEIIEYLAMVKNTMKIRIYGLIA